MSADNHVTVVGNCTRDPEMRYTPSGASLCNFGIAVSKRWRNQQTNEWEEQTSFFNVTAWKTLAENVAASVTKGMRVVVMGELQQRSWEDDNGDKKSVVQITADDIAPSLRFATASVAKVAREGASEAPKRQPSAPATDDYAYSDEPF